MYAVYILLCTDGSYYTGLTNDFDKRMWQHDTGYFQECYTYNKRPLKIVWQTRVETAEEANKLERQIKGWSRKKKEALMNGDIDKLKEFSKPSTLRQAQGKILIIGQGISGTFLSYFLHKAGIDFIVIDDAKPNASSRVAAGLINPVTGRRVVKVWLDDVIIPFADKAYTEMGALLNIKAFDKKKIIEFFPNPFMKENFLKKLNQKEDYIDLIDDENFLKEYFNYEFGSGSIYPAFVIHLSNILPAWKDFLKKQNKFIEERFDANLLKVSQEIIIYKNIEADKIIFCDGAAGFNNPYFSLLPFALNKGEAIIIEAPELPGDYIYKKSMTLVPTAEKGFFWLGTNYIWDFKDDLPTKEFKTSVDQTLKNWLKVPYKIVEHRAAIRPATVERRPFAGFHPIYKNVGILNGMGTKGCSLAPYFAHQLCENILHHALLQKDADIARFEKILKRKDF